MSENQKRVTLINMNALEGFVSFDMGLALAGQMQAKGINAICEQTPGAALEGVASYIMTVPLDQLEQARKVLKEVLAE